MNLREFSNAAITDESEADSGGPQFESSELESGLDAIDSRLVRHRRAPNRWVEAPPGLPHEAGGLALTPDAMEDLADRVAERLRTPRPAPPPPSDVPMAVAPFTAPVGDRTAPERRAHGMRSDSLVSIQVRWPLFRFGFFRSRRANR